MKIARQLYSKATELLGKYPLIAITGPRQSGKTTFCKQLRPHYQFLNMELADNQDFARKDPHGFLQKYQGGVVLDEVQNVPELFPYLQYYTDERGSKGEYILSGSQHFLLLEKITQSLAGRIAIFNLLPFSLAELEGHEWQPDTWQLAVWKGFYPRIYEAKISPNDFYPDYLQTYIERDVRQILKVADLNQFRAFIVSCAGRCGQLFNAAQIGNEIGVDAKTVKNWLSVLETSFITYRLPPYHKNFSKRIVKTPKLYFYDVGLAAHLLGIRRPDDVDAHFAKGAVFENMVVNEIIKNCVNRHERPTLYFWQDSNNIEIDLLIDRVSSREIIEIKAGSTIQPLFFKNIEKYGDLDSQVTAKWLVYGGEDEQTRSSVRVVSWKGIPTLGFEP
jgi:hypothetical protein